MLDECKNCGCQITHENGSWVDHSGGDVCGVDGTNSSHEPYESRTSLRDFGQNEKQRLSQHVENLLFGNKLNQVQFRKFPRNPTRPPNRQF
jgi:hypothetical protein